MADAGAANLDTIVLMEKRGRDRPRSSKNKPKDGSLVASSSASAKRRTGRPLGSKNKPRHLLPLPQVPALLLAMTLLLLLSRFIIFSISLVLNAMSSSVFR
jgi:hypothetical protein